MPGRVRTALAVPAQQGPRELQAAQAQQVQQGLEWVRRDQQVLQARLVVLVRLEQELLAQQDRQGRPGIRVPLVPPEARGLQEQLEAREVELLEQLGERVLQAPLVLVLEPLVPQGLLALPVIQVSQAPLAQPEQVLPVRQALLALREQTAPMEQ